MQYTGLKDISTPPQDIYEGDIFKHFWRDGKTNKERPETISYWVVEWNKQECAFLVKKISGDDRFRKNGSFDSLRAFRYGNIIGNIHQNPELLDNK